MWAAALANGGSLDNAQPGLDFFKQLNDAGNFVPVIAKAATVASGETPIRIAWTYNGLADKDSLAGNPPIEVAVPTTGRFGGMYVQAISAYAPHPNAAKLWMEYLYSDEGQLIWLKGYCNPIRYDDMVGAEGRPGRPARRSSRHRRRGPADARPDHGRDHGHRRRLADHGRRRPSSRPSPTDRGRGRPVTDAAIRRDAQDAPPARPGASRS